MKGWLVNNDGEFVAEELVNEDLNEGANTVKVKIKKALVTVADVLRYTGEYDCKNTVLGSTGVGIIAQDMPSDSIFSLKKGARVYVTPYKNCKECIYCKNNDKSRCADILVAGEDYDGFLKEFVDVDASSIFAIPEHVSDKSALFIETVSLCLNIIDRLSIQKGEHVLILGADNFGIILAQILKYYQSIPILIDNDEDRINLAKDCGIYYSLSNEYNRLNEVLQITNGKLAPKVVYALDSKIPLKQAFALAGYNAQIAISGMGKHSNIVSFTPAIKKDLNLCFVNTGYGNTEASINLIANGAIDLTKFDIKNAPFEECDKVFEALSKTLSEEETVNEVVIELKDVLT